MLPAACSPHEGASNSDAERDAARAESRAVKRWLFFMSNALTVTGLVTLYIEKQMWLAI